MDTPTQLIKGACNNCRHAHKACNRKGPPCGRCIEFGLDKSCSFQGSRTPSSTGGSHHKVSGPAKRQKFTQQKSEDEENDMVDDKITHSSKKESTPQDSDVKAESPPVPTSPLLRTPRIRTPRDKSHERTYHRESNYLLDSFGDFQRYSYPPFPEGSNTKLTVILPEDDPQLSSTIEKDAITCTPLPKKSDKHDLELPEAKCREVAEDWDKLPDHERIMKLLEWERPASYIVYQEKTQDEQDEMVEYDMDSEDEAWLKSYNETRSKDGTDRISEDSFELVIDRLEKVSFAEESIRQSTMPPPEDIDVENTNCCICNDDTSDDTNQIVFCDGCDIAVHQECYGIRYIPEGLWLCQKCQSKATDVKCIFCPNTDGAFKRTTTGEWAHALCAMWIPEVTFLPSADGMRGDIDSIDKIPKPRWKLECELCHIQQGACIQCKKATCNVSFHVTCAQKHRLYMEVKEKPEYVVHVAACPEHTPKKYKLKAFNKSPRKQRNLSKNKKETSQKKKKFLELISHDTVSLDTAEKAIGTEAPPGSLPAIWEYWVNKRKLRSGNPLLKRFSVCVIVGTVLTVQKSIIFSPRFTPRKISGNRKWENLQEMRALRRDLEKCRTILEIVKKREKAKLQRLKVIRDIVDVCTNPLQRALRMTLDLFIKEDRSGFFHRDVPRELFPDYYEKITTPMTFSTMQQKISDAQYSSIQEFWDDLGLTFSNAIKYNSDPSSVIYQEAERLSKLRDDLMRQVSLSDEEFAKEKEQQLEQQRQQQLEEEQRHQELLGKQKQQRPITEGKPMDIENNNEASSESKLNLSGLALQQTLDQILIRFIETDKQRIFYDEVSASEVPDYYTVIEQPMAFYTMNSKLDAGNYKSLNQFWDDLKLICKNATTYNRANTIFYKTAKTLQWMADKIYQKLSTGNHRPSSTCLACRRSSDPGKLLNCDGCDRSYHTYCLSPPLKKQPKGFWFCSECDPSKHCNLCQRETEPTNAIKCDGCDKAYHVSCLKNNPDTAPSKGLNPKHKWYCLGCSKELPVTHSQYSGDQRRVRNGKRKDSLDPTEAQKNQVSDASDGEPKKKAPKPPRVAPDHPGKYWEKKIQRTAKGEVVKLTGACAEHKRRKKRCPENCPGRLALERKRMQTVDHLSHFKVANQRQQKLQREQDKLYGQKSEEDTFVNNNNNNNIRSEIPYHGTPHKRKKSYRPKIAPESDESESLDLSSDSDSDSGFTSNPPSFTSDTPTRSTRQRSKQPPAEYSLHDDTGSPSHSFRSSPSPSLVRGGSPKFFDPTLSPQMPLPSFHDEDFEPKELRIHEFHQVESSDSSEGSEDESGSSESELEPSQFFDDPEDDLKRPPLSARRRRIS